MKNIITLLGSVAAVFTIVLAANTVNATSHTPLILVPTTLGTLPGAGGHTLDPIFDTYKNFLETYQNNGYTLGVDLQVFTYDWQQPLADTAAALGNLVSNVKTQTGATAVDIVGHGQGGLIAWHYHDNGGDANINKLVLLGAPIGGVPASYLAWGGGEFRVHATPLGQGLGQALLDSHAVAAGQTTYDYIQDNARAFRDLLPIPSIDTGAYLPGNHPANPFMEGLWGGLLEPILGADGHLMIRGDLTADNTIRSFDVVASTNPPLWPNGEPTSRLFDFGDGITLREWAIFFDAAGVNSVLEASHDELPTEAQEEIFAFLNGSAPSSPSTTAGPSISCLLFITTSADTNMAIAGPGGEQLSDGLNTFTRAFYSGSSYDPEYAVIANPGNEIYEVAVSGGSGQSFTVDALEICEGGTRAGTLTETLGGDGTLDVVVSLTPGAVTVSVPVVDTEAPVVTITSPVAAQVYLPTDEVLATATITDASPFTVEYLFNTNAIDPNQPLPLGSAPLGAATVEVIATDSAGNVGSSSVSFFIGEDSSADTGAPVVTITSPVAGSTHFSDATVHATADITDPEGSSIIETVYSFNGEVIDYTQPLPLFDAPLGAATVSVEATDSAGNTGSSTVSFTIAEPPPEPDTYTIEFLPPISAKCYIHSKKAGISKLWKRVFDRLHIHSKFKDYFKRYIDCRDISIFSAGSTIPVKFRVKNDDGQYVQTDGAIAWIEPIKGPSLNSPIEEMEYTEQPSTGYFYSWKGSHYQYNWKTSRSQRGYWYNLFVVLPDGSIHQTIIGLR
jgi:pimeloyl-ACP methyl ester carboxylesterase